MQTLVIEPPPRFPRPRLREAWARRDLLLFLAVRDLKVRYAQTILGAVWTLLQPLAMMLVFTLAFRKIGKVDSAGVPYPVFALAGLTFWTLFSRGLTQGAESLVANGALVTKTAAPRLLIPLATITAALFDFAITLALLLVVAGAYGELSGWPLLVLPAIVALGVAFLLAPTLLLSALNVSYRDVRHVLPFTVSLWLFLSPVAYEIDVLGDPWSSIAALNPLVGIVEAFRWSVVGTDPPSGLEIGAALGVTAISLAVAITYFARAERSFADRA